MSNSEALPPFGRKGAGPWETCARVCVRVCARVCVCVTEMSRVSGEKGLWSLRGAGYIRIYWKGRVLEAGPLSERKVSKTDLE